MCNIQKNCIAFSCRNYDLNATWIIDESMVFSRVCSSIPPSFLKLVRMFVDDQYQFAHQLLFLLQILVAKVRHAFMPPFLCYLIDVAKTKKTCAIGPYTQFLTFAQGLRIICWPSPLEIV